MEFFFLLLALYSVFLLAAHVPMLVAYFILKKFGLLRPWHFMVTCAMVFALAHTLYAAAFFRPAPFIEPFTLGAGLGLLCGYVWWYILVKRIGLGSHASPSSKDHVQAS